MELDNYSILKKNKAYIFQEMKSSKSRQTFSTIFGFYIMICIYVPKVQEKSLYRCQRRTIASGPKKNQKFYNKTKSGVDIIDKLLGCYIMHRQTNR